MNWKTIQLITAGIIFLGTCPALAGQKADPNDDTVSKCKILEKRKRGHREPAGYVIKAYNNSGKKLDEYRAPDGGLFTRYDEAGLTLLTLVDNGDCPTK